MDYSEDSIYIIGNGRVGNWFYDQIKTVYKSVNILSSKEIDKFNFKSSRSNHFFLAVPDNAINSVANDLVKFLSKVLVDLNGVSLFHFSGSLTSDVFDKKIITKCASIHPAFSVPKTSETIINNEDRFFILEGNIDAQQFLQKILGQLAFKYLIVKTEFKPLYHALCVLSSSLIMPFIDSLYNGMNKCGFSDQDSKNLITSLINSGKSNLDQYDLENGLTGPHKRRDLETIELNLKALESFNPKLRDIYLSFSKLLD